MKGRKILLPLCLTAAFITLISFQNLNPEDDESDADIDYDSFAMDPPFVESVRVKKLTTPLSDGSTMLMAIRYGDAVVLGETINIYQGEDNETVTFYDDGTHGDETADDHIFTRGFEIDPSVFVAYVEGIENDIDNQGQFIRFTGHVGEIVTETPLFNDAIFDAGAWADVNKDLIEAGTQCLINGNTGIVKENSLFITHLDVVEDEARTYNPVNPPSNPPSTGNGLGCWTFGYMMKNIANGNPNPRTVEFLKNWLMNWTDGSTLNIPMREENYFFTAVIKPWLERSGSTNVTFNNWGGIWDTYESHEDDLLKNAPFKLTAIVNRIDLRSNTAFVPFLFSAGETRFIFTLVSLADPQASSGTSMYPPGEPPKHPNTGENASKTLDWNGMNIIFEYGNVQNDLCELKAFAQQWKDLGSLTLGSSAYNDALELITNTVTSANAVPGKPNGSALNRIRTNEKIFARVTSSGGGFNWASADWEFRQFEINPTTHNLEPALLTNTPKHSANAAKYISGTGNTGGNLDFNKLPQSDEAFPASSNDKNTLMDMVYGPSLYYLTVKNGKPKMPASYLTSFARIDGEYVHYWGLDFKTSTTHFNAGNYSSSGNYPTEREYRHQLSLNTCQGCHAGETKTIFTHIRPLGYGTPADYWITTPSTTSGTFDDRHVRNTGYTNSTGNYELPSTRTSLDNVSAFLTGRTYANGSWDDDDPYDADDNNMDGLYMVNDPDNGSYISLPPNNNRHGFNDLQRRATDLCLLLSRSCATSVIAEPNVDGMFEIMHKVIFQPFAFGSH